MRPYSLAATDHWHFIPADDYLVLINEVRDIRRLKRALEPVQDYYYFIIIDYTTVMIPLDLSSWYTHSATSRDIADVIV